jgi:hypothetical protein
MSSGMSGMSSISSDIPNAVWNFGPVQSEDYAARVTGYEALGKLGSPTAVRDHVTVQDVTGIIPELYDSPFLRVPPPVPYALFSAPPRWKMQFRSLFSPKGLITSFGNTRDVELAMANVQATQVDGQSQRRQKSALSSLFEVYSDLSDMLHHIRGRMGQFVGA